MTVSEARGGDLAVLRRRWILLLSALAALPFLFVSIPPLVDVPGHIGRYAVQVAPADSPMRGYFSFEWALVLNLGTDLLVELLHPLLDVFEATWLICAAVPVITAFGILALARTLNPGGAHAVPWALLFVYNGAFLWGFVNWALAAGLALTGFALWVRMEARPRLRALSFFLVPPVLFVVHGVGGALLPLMAGSWEIWRRGAYRPGNWSWAVAAGLIRTLWPFAGCLLFLAGYVAAGQQGTGVTNWSLEQKGLALVSMLRDQNIFLDIATVVAAAVVVLLGRRWGARFRNGTPGPMIVIAALFLLVPGMLAGSNHVDTRLAPMLPMLALALQDWSAVEASRRRRIFAAGAALLAFRLLLTVLSFIAYERSYGRELAALDHIRPGARVYNLSWAGCGRGSWRRARLEHLSNLATPLRQAWVNSHWALDGLHLLRVRYRPSPDFFRDPSHLAFPPECATPAKRAARPERRTVADIVPALPLDGADYLWLVEHRLPPELANPRLRRIWSSDVSELYAIVPR